VAPIARAVASLFAFERSQPAFEALLLLLLRRAVALILSQLILLDEQLRVSQQLADALPDQLFNPGA